MTKDIRCGIPRRNQSFIDCNEPDTTTFIGIRCKRCGVEVSAQEWDAMNDAKEATQQGSFER